MSAVLDYPSTYASTHEPPPPSGRRVPWIPPKHYMGQQILYYPSGDRRDVPMIGVLATPIGRAHTIIAYGTDRHVHTVKKGVYHADDPAQSEEIVRQMGCWEHTPETKEREHVYAQLVAKGVLTFPDDPCADLTIEDIRQQLGNLGVNPHPALGKIELGLELIAARAKQRASAKAEKGKS